MTLLAHARGWASDGIEPLFDRYVLAPQAFTEEEALALVRAAYTLGYVDAYVDEPSPLPILRACQFSSALRLTLPLP